MRMSFRENNENENENQLYFLKLILILILILLYTQVDIITWYHVNEDDKHVLKTMILSHFMFKFAALLRGGYKEK